MSSLILLSGMSSSGTTRTDKPPPADDEIHRLVKKLKQTVKKKISQQIRFRDPTAKIGAIHIPTINHTKTQIEVDLHLQNPNSLPIPHTHLTYSFESNNKILSCGVISDVGTLHSHASRTVKIPITLTAAPGTTIPYKIKVMVMVNLPVIGRISVPVEKTGNISLPHKPDVDLVMINFEKFCFEEAMVTLYMKLGKLHVFDMGVRCMDYEVWIDGVSIGGVQFEKYVTLGKRGVSYVEMSMRFKPMDFGSAVWDVVRRKSRGWSVRGNVSVDTLFGVTKLAISKEGGIGHRLEKGERLKK